MAILKCKMCGGNLEINDDITVSECEYCGTKQTIPTADNEKKLALFSRANRLRFSCEFDKAAGVYENIVVEFPEEAEAYWGLVLCKYGIEYVDDPTTGKKIPTCHRSSFDSVMDDNNFDMVMETSDPIARKVYRDEAKSIEEIRKGIVEVSSKEEPYDIFICYKETDEEGNRTIDSVLAQDIYEMLKENKYRVFFSRISLEDKLGTEYEPYIFAALNSAKILLAIGTDYEYYNAVWVKNEWSRFLQLMTTDKTKSLIPCYKNIDAYDIPKEFAKLQAQDLGKIGAMQDLLRGIKKLLPKDQPQKAMSYSSDYAIHNTSVEPLLERAFIFLEDSNWKSADEYFERVLDMNPKSSHAYLGKLLIQAKCTSEKALFDSRIIITELSSFGLLSRYGDEETINRIKAHDKKEQERRVEEKRLDEEKRKKEEEARRVAQLENSYNQANSLMNNIGSTDSLNKALDILIRIKDYKDASEKIELCKEQLEKIRLEYIHNKYLEAKSIMQSNTVYNVSAVKGMTDAIDSFKQLGDYLDSKSLLLECKSILSKFKEEEAVYARFNRKMALQRDIQALQRKLTNMTSFNSTDYERRQIKTAIKQMKSELKTVSWQVEQDEARKK